MKRPGKVSGLLYSFPVFPENKFNMKSKTLIPLIVLFSFLFSCKESACDLSTKSLLQIGFYRVKKNIGTITSLDSLTVFGLGKEGDSLYKNKSVSSVLIPLSQNQDMSSFIISRKDTIDTLSINYTRQLKLISKECGFATIFEINTATISNHKFDSVKIINPVINTANEENIRIYF